MNILNKVKAAIFSEKEITEILNSLDRNQLESLSGEIYGELYWQKQMPVWKSIDSRKAQARLVRLRKRIDKKVKAGNCKSELTEFGSELIRSSASCFGFVYAEEYASVFLKDPDWKYIYDQGLSAAWIHWTKLEIVSYCEGSVTTVICKDAHQLYLEFMSFKSWLAEEAA